MVLYRYLYTKGIEMTKKKPKVDKSKAVFLYCQFADVLRKEILSGRHKPGEYIPSERQLSETHDINRITVRRGLAQLIKEGILYSVPGTGTFVSEATNLQQALERKKGVRGLTKKKNINCMVRCLPPTIQSPILSPYYIGIFTMLQRESSRLGYNISFNFITSLKEEKEIARTILERNTDGVILIGKMERNFIVSLYSKKISLVLIDNYLDRPNIPSVIPDNKRGAYLAVKYLVDLGHRKIGFISAPLDQPAATERLEGYKQTLEEAKIKFDENLIVEGSFTTEDGYKAMEEFLKRRKLPTAIFAINDETAIGAMKAIREKSKLLIPRDISIVGFDDVEWASHSYPPLTTVKIYKEEMGTIAVRKLAELLEGETSFSTKTIIPVELIIRQSCFSSRR